MRILSLHPRSWNGEYDMLRQWRGMGHEVCALEEKRDLPQGERWLADFYRQPGDGIATFWYDPRRGTEKLLTWVFDRLFRRAFDGRNLVHRMWIIHTAVRHFQPDVVFCSDGFSYALPACFLKRMGLLPMRLLVSYIGGDIMDCPHASYGKRRTWLTDRLIKASLKAPDVLRAVSPLLELILLRDGADKSRVHVLPSHLVAGREVLSAVRARRAVVGSAMRQRYGIPATAPLIVSLSGNQMGKGIDVLARAWPAVIEAFPEARWLLCGPQREWITQVVIPTLQERDLLPTVVMSGELGGIDVFEHLAAADLNVNPSLCEGLNMVVAEAAAVGTPTIGSDGAGIAEWIERHDAGLVTPAGEAAPLADAIIRAFQNRAELVRWSIGAEIMSRDFALEHIAEQLQQLLIPSPVPGTP